MITEREAEAVTEILLGAHDSCIMCSRELCQEFIGQFPYHRTTVNALWKMKHPDIPLYMKPRLGGVLSY